jgi:hypothetical protein
VQSADRKSRRRSNRVGLRLGADDGIEELTDRRTAWRRKQVHARAVSRLRTTGRSTGARRRFISFVFIRNTSGEDIHIPRVLRKQSFVIAYACRRSVNLHARPAAGEKADDIRVFMLPFVMYFELSLTVGFVHVQRFCFVSLPRHIIWYNRCRELL